MWSSIPASFRSSTITTIELRTMSVGSSAGARSYRSRPSRSCGTAHTRTTGGRRRRAELAKHIEQYHVVWANPRLIRLSARLRSDRRSAGRELKSADAWIAATALLLECPLASHDGDFADIPGIELLRRDHGSEG